MTKSAWLLVATVGILWCFCVSTSNAQISPGPLSTSHAFLEGMDHCTSCHALGKTIADDKCRVCHEEVFSRQQQGKGLHATYQGRRCIECHKEHHGKGFSIIKFDTTAFVHKTVGYVLDGAHAHLRCRECHRQDKLRADDILGRPEERRSRTFLGLPTNCVGCHRDPHGAQLGAVCTRCHGQEHWTPVDLFSHDRARFKLAGMHAHVACVRCHPGQDGGKNPRYSGLKFSTCQSCHHDPHQGKFGDNCERCHSTAGWQSGATSGFDHSMTRFALQGKHRTLPCEKCHPGASAAPVKSKPYRVAAFGRCTDCHADAHRGQLKQRPDQGACESCHTVDGFRPSTFTIELHDSTVFALRGAHKAVSCVRCHETAESNAGFVFSPVKGALCTECHEDVHQGQFARRMTKSCEACHPVTKWIPVEFSHDDTRFPLEGKHASVACTSCHPLVSINGKSTRKYADLPLNCEECH